MDTPYLFDADLLGRGIKVYYGIDLDTHPHILCVGATGSGKTYALRLLLGKLVKHNDASLVICDFKKSGFGDLGGYAGFYGYTDVLDGIDAVYAEFQSRLEANNDERNATKIILLIDEYSALISSLEKKQADEVKRKIGSILMMGRSLGIHLIIGIQRADAEFFRSGSREQFGAIFMLGNISKEQKMMLVPDYKDTMTAINRRGQGYLYLDGKGLYHVQVPTVTRPTRLTNILQTHLGLLQTNTPPSDAGEA